MKLSNIVPGLVSDKEIKSKTLKYILLKIVRPIIGTIIKFNENLYTTKIDRWIPPKIVSDKYKFIYIINPLCATRSFIAHFIKQPSLEYEAYMISEKIVNTKVHRKNYTVFSSVRHPWSKLVSGYRKQVLNANTLRKVALLSQYSGLKPQMTFEEFVIWMCENKHDTEVFDSHWTPQYKILTNEHNQIIPNHIIHLENIDEEYKKLCIEENIPYKPLPMIASSRELMYTGNCQNYYECIDLIKDRYRKCLIDIYRKDFDIFDYSTSRVSSI